MTSHRRNRPRYEGQVAVVTGASSGIVAPVAYQRAMRRLATTG